MVWSALSFANEGSKVGTFALRQSILFLCLFTLTYSSDTPPPTPEITGIVSTGGISSNLVISGTNFGTSPSVTIAINDGVQTPFVSVIQTDGSLLVNGPILDSETTPSANGIWKASVRVLNSNAFDLNLFKPIISDILPNNKGICAGGNIIQINGFNLLNPSNSNPGHVLVGGYDCPIKNDFANTAISLQCVTPSTIIDCENKAPNDVGVQVKVDGESSDSFEFIYQDPEITFTPTSFIIGKNVAIDVTVNNLFLNNIPDPILMIGTEICTDVTVSASKTSIQCNTLPSFTTASNVNIKVTYGTNTFSSTSLFGILIPKLLSFDVNSGIAGQTTPIEVTVENFDVSFMNDVQILFDTTPATITKTSFSSNKFKMILPDSFNGKPTPISMKIGTLNAHVATGLTFTFYQHTITSLSIYEGLSVGGDKIEIRGELLSQVSSVTINGNDCPIQADEPKTDKVLTCKVPAVDAALLNQANGFRYESSISAIINGANSIYTYGKKFTYYQPAIESIDPNPAMDKIKIYLIEGYNLDEISSITIGGVSCQIVDTINSGNVECAFVLPTTTDITNPLPVVLKEISSTSSFTSPPTNLHFVKPTITADRNGKISGNEIITFTCTNLYEIPILILLGASKCDIIPSSLATNAPFNSFQCTSPSTNVAGAVGVTLNTKNTQYIFANAFTYYKLTNSKVPTVTSTTGPLSTPQGGALTLTGTKFLETTSVTIGGTSCVFTVVSETSMIVTSPPKSPANNPHPLVITIQGGSTSNPVNINYNGRSITSISPTRGSRKIITPITVTTPTNQNTPNSIRLVLTTNPTTIVNIPTFTNDGATNIRFNAPATTVSGIYRVELIHTTGTTVDQVTFEYVGLTCKGARQAGSTFNPDVLWWLQIYLRQAQVPNHYLYYDNTMTDMIRRVGFDDITSPLAATFIQREEYYYMTWDDYDGGSSKAHLKQMLFYDTTETGQVTEAIHIMHSLPGFPNDIEPGTDGWVPPAEKAQHFFCYQVTDIETTSLMIARTHPRLTYSANDDNLNAVAFPNLQILIDQNTRNYGQTCVNGLLATPPTLDNCRWRVPLVIPGINAPQFFSRVQLPSISNANFKANGVVALGRSIILNSSPLLRSNKIDIYFQYDGFDMWQGVAEFYDRNLFVQTWCSSEDRLFSVNSKIVNVERTEYPVHLSHNTGTGYVGHYNKMRGHDHSKLAYSMYPVYGTEAEETDANENLFCIGDLNRHKGQAKRGGTVLCFNNPKLSKQFNQFVKSYSSFGYQPVVTHGKTGTQKSKVKFGEDDNNRIVYQTQTIGTDIVPIPTFLPQEIGDEGGVDETIIFRTPTSKTITIQSTATISPGSAVPWTNQIYFEVRQELIGDLQPPYTPRIIRQTALSAGNQVFYNALRTRTTPIFRPGVNIAPSVEPPAFGPLPPYVKGAPDPVQTPFTGGHNTIDSVVGLEVPIVDGTNANPIWSYRAQNSLSVHYLAYDDLVARICESNEITLANGCNDINYALFTKISVVVPNEQFPPTREVQFPLIGGHINYQLLPDIREFEIIRFVNQFKTLYTLPTNIYSFILDTTLTRSYPTATAPFNIMLNRRNYCPDELSYLLILNSIYRVSGIESPISFLPTDPLNWANGIALALSKVVSNLYNDGTIESNPEFGACFNLVPAAFNLDTYTETTPTMNSYQWTAVATWKLMTEATNRVNHIDLFNYITTLVKSRGMTGLGDIFNSDTLIDRANKELLIDNHIIKRESMKRKNTLLSSSRISSISNDNIVQLIQSQFSIFEIASLDSIDFNLLLNSMNKWTTINGVNQFISTFFNRRTEMSNEIEFIYDYSLLSENNFEVCTISPTSEYLTVCAPDSIKSITNQLERMMIASTSYSVSDDFEFYYFSKPTGLPFIQEYPDFTGLVISKFNYQLCDIKLINLGQSATFDPNDASLSSICSDSGPIINSISKTSGKAIGGDTITISGFRFTSDMIIKIGGIDCQTTNVISSTQIKCITPPNIGFNLAITSNIPINQQSQFTFSYDEPLVYEISPKIINSNGQQISIFGENFGPSSQQSNSLISIGSIPCVFGPNSFWSDSLIVCSVPSGSGIFKTISITINQFEIYNNVSKRTFNYLAPDIQSISQNHGDPFDWILIRGNGFNNKSQIYFNNSQSDIISFASDYIYTQVPYGVGKNIQISIESGNQKSNNFKFDYDQPILEFINPKILPTTGGIIRLNGYGFGNSYFGNITFGLKNISCVFLSDIIECPIPAGIGKDIPFNFNIEGQPLISLLPSNFSYSRPIIEKTEFNSGSVTIFGQNFIPSGIEVNPLKSYVTLFKDNVISTQCSSTIFTNNQQIICNFDQSFIVRSIFVTIGGQTSSIYHPTSLISLYLYIDQQISGIKTNVPVTSESVSVAISSDSKLIQNIKVDSKGYISFNATLGTFNLIYSTTSPTLIPIINDITIQVTSTQPTNYNHAFYQWNSGTTLSPAKFFSSTPGSYLSLPVGIFNNIASIFNSIGSFISTSSLNVLLYKSDGTIVSSNQLSNGVIIDKIEVSSPSLFTPLQNINCVEQSITFTNNYMNQIPQLILSNYGTLTCTADNPQITSMTCSIPAATGTISLQWNGFTSANTFNLQPKEIVFGYVYNDLNSNNIFDQNEPVISNAQITLSKTIEVSKTSTNSQGYYSIPNITPGQQYLMSLDPITGYIAPMDKITFLENSCPSPTQVNFAVKPLSSNGCVGYISSASSNKLTIQAGLNSLTSYGWCKSPSVCTNQFTSVTLPPRCVYTYDSTNNEITVSLGGQSNINLYNDPSITGVQKNSPITSSVSLVFKQSNGMVISTLTPDSKGNVSISLQYDSYIVSVISTNTQLFPILDNIPFQLNSAKPFFNSSIGFITWKYNTNYPLVKFYQQTDFSGI
ncbi:hypothetical protein PPL_03640, partial [Heterostelium album PN500]